MIKQLTFVFFLLISTYSLSQKSKKIDIINADELTIVKKGKIELKKLKGNVIFKHEDALMYCDSSFFNSAENTMEAFGNVKIEAKDSIRLFCNFLKYNGKTKVANTRGNIRLYHKKSILITDSLDFYRTSGVAKYFTYGTIISGNDTLTSKYGFYYSKTRDFYPILNVEVKNPNFIMFTDSLRFNTKSKKVYFLTKTRIISDSSLIVCYKGYYDTEKDFAFFGKKTFIKQGKNILKGDSLFYDNKKNYGEGYKYFYIEDTINKVAVSGKFGIYEGMKNSIMITDSACFTQFENVEDTLFLHSDTLKSIEDTSGKMLFAYKSVLFFRNDFQGKCDSLVYSFSDSTVRMYGNPVLWFDNFQLTANQIEILSNNEGIKQVNLINAGFIVEQIDTNIYNQINGSTIYAFFKEGEIYKIDVKRNAKTVYYPIDDSTITGLYNANAANIRIMLDSGKVTKILFLSSPEGILYPINNMNDENAFLPGFVWYIKYRPLRKEDIFIKKF